MMYGQRLPMVEDFYTDLGGHAPPGYDPATDPRLARMRAAGSTWNPYAHTEPGPMYPEARKTIAAMPTEGWILLAIGLAIPVGGAILGYKLLKDRIPLGGLVGAVGGFFIVPKVAGPIIGPILKPFAEKALAKARAAGCTSCGE